MRFWFLAVVFCLQRFPVNIECLTQTEINSCVAAHNQLRYLHKDTPGLQWDDSLAAKAQEYAEKLLAMHYGTLDTSLIHDTQSLGLGENLYWSDNAHATTCAHASLAWYQEVDDYDYSTARTKNGKQVGHFTQMVWKETTKFGVGIATGKSRFFSEYGNVETFIVAKYSPQGNFYWNGQRYKDYSSNVLPRLPGAVTPTLAQLQASFKPKQPCENVGGNKHCQRLLKDIPCRGPFEDYLEKNCYKDCYC